MPENNVTFVTWEIKSTISVCFQFYDRDFTRLNRQFINVVKNVTIIEAIDVKIFIGTRQIH